MGVIAILFWIVYLLIWCSVLGAMEAFLVVSYIFSAKSLYTIARRRGFEKPWLAWVPVGNAWLLGAISDQYRQVVHGQTRNRRKLLMLLAGGLMAVALLLLTVCVIWCIGIIAAAVAGGEEAVFGIYAIGFILIWLMCVGLIAFGAVVSVFEYMAYYDLYRSCDPGKSLVYLLVGIFVGYPTPFFLHSCRNKDLGMIPKQEETPPEQSDEPQQKENM